MPLDVGNRIDYGPYESEWKGEHREDVAYIQHVGRVKPTVIVKPWGFEEIWADTSSAYIGKILNIYEGESLSLQYHPEKTETLMVIEGVVELLYGHIEKQAPLNRYLLGEGSTIHIPPGTVHRFTAKSKNVRLVEVSTNSNDIVRLEDRYNRLNP